MNHIQSNAWYLLLRAHDHLWRDTPGLDSGVKWDSSQVIWKHACALAPNATVPAVVIGGKRLLEVGIKLLK